jgi:hypothetical protein
LHLAAPLPLDFAPLVAELFAEIVL